MNRRDFLKAGAASALLLAGGLDIKARWGLPKASAADVKHKDVVYPQGRKVDMHAHAILPSYIKGMEALGIDPVAEEGYPLPKWSESAHLEFMDEAGIDYTVLSLPTPHIYRRGQEELSCRTARDINEEMAKICKKYPDRFGFVATLPFPHVEGSLTELEYAVSTLGALGAKLPSNAYGIYLGDEGQEEIFAELSRRKSLVIIHPSPARQLPRKGVVTGRVMALFEYPTDTTRAVLNLLASGILERHPDMKLLVPHCGSFLPYMRSRARAMFAMLANLSLMESVDIDKAMGSLWWDLAGDPMPEEMDMLLSVTDTLHLVYGSDYPYVPAPILLGKKAALDAELSKRQQMEQIYVKNPRRLYERR